MNEKNHEGGRQRLRRRRSWVLGIGLLLAAGIGRSWLDKGDGPPAEQAGVAQDLQATAVAPAVATASAARPAPASPSSPATASAVPTAAGSQHPWPPLPPERLAQIEKQWCSHGQTAHLQAMAAIDRAHPVDYSASQVDEAAVDAHVEATFQEIGYQARDAVRERLRQRWIAQLQGRGDARSRAAAAYIGLKGYHGDTKTAHLLSLRALAESGSDPLVWHLWRMARPYCHEASACGPEVLKPWRSIEADNLLAWLPALRDESEIRDADWQGIRSARHARSYHEDFIGLLLPLLEREPPGLALQEGISLVSSLGSHWPTVGSTLPLVRACTENAQALSAERRSDCLHAAELLWRMAQPSLYDRGFAARIAVAAGAGEQPAWQPRLTFMKTFSEDDGRRFLDAQFRHNWDRQGCEAQPRQRQKLKDIAQGGEWAAALGPERAARTP